MKKEKIIKYIVLIVSILIYYYLINNQYIYNFNYLKCIIYSLLISLFIYTYGILINDKNNYKFNIKIYLIIYFITLTSLTFIIGRPNLRFYNFKFYGQYNLFFTIISQLKNGTNYSIFKNIIGNLVIFIPFSLLLMINNKKYNNVLKQTIIILPIIICIELIQAFTHIGSFDIDDIFLNYLGVVLFIFLITRFNFINKIRNLFYTDYKLKNETKYVLFYLSLFMLIIYQIYLFISKI